MKPKRLEVTKPEAPEARPSSVEQHPRWPEVRAFLDTEPGENTPLAKHLRDLGRIEAEAREVGGGGNLLGEVRRLERQAEEARRLTVPCVACRRPVDPGLISARAAAEDALAAKSRELESREARIAEIGKRQKKAHGLAVAALHSALRVRFKALATEAVALVRSAPHAGRLPDSLLDVGRQVALGHALALAFSSTTVGQTASETDFFAAMPEDIRLLMEGKILAGRSVMSAVA